MRSKYTVVGLDNKKEKNTEESAGTRALITELSSEMTSMGTELEESGEHFALLMGNREEG